MAVPSLRKGLATHCRVNVSPPFHLLRPSDSASPRDMRTEADRILHRPVNPLNEHIFIKKVLGGKCKDQHANIPKSALHTNDRVVTELKTECRGPNSRTEHNRMVSSRDREIRFPSERKRNIRLDYWQSPDTTRRRAVHDTRVENLVAGGL